MRLTVRGALRGEQFLDSGACDRLDQVPLKSRHARELATGMLSAIRQRNQSQFPQ
jgi:hypothetical protein